MSRLEISRINRGWVMRSHDHVTHDEFDAAISNIASRGGGPVRWFVFEPNNDEHGFAVDNGFTPDTPLLHMRCDLPLAAHHHVPPGFTTRPFRPGVDDEEWLSVNARAFAGHPEQGEWTQAELAARLAEPWFDSEGFLIHEIKGRIAGYCWTKTHRSIPPYGEIYVIGVDPAHHGKGLGRALTIAGFARLSSLGLRHGVLYVAGDNAAAIGLYESLGMRTVHRDEVFAGIVPSSRT
ncbi:MAG: mycothiol synthase [Actinobacteria bacterium]|nr:mycothiol synthase [Actinomycetota bacterium]NCV09413.1 mycothiol synthase [Actinomycetota bacterium]NDA54506.1 mycothiol synthase [Actinomycetota bacterium]NDH92264.1 mycothiol synthase [Actinomycetota bacterium]